MDMAARSRKPHLAVWLLTCPLLLVAAVLVLPRFNLYGTPAERYTLLALLALPLVGAIGIARYMQSTLLARLLLAAGYLIAGLVLALYAVIFVGCSWAGACF
ncbi:hypothetical protein [Pseudoxanthomonas sp.]|uniref:hypothetical protein n=1 Tax=Pseudoxanthomonas sp. TaxID=1871049 RepID=UPI00262776D4|nr:hypothetical protein [Pseudoxanthomonas sp.]WDS35236.1 MAG: hypothetical protein O8I58_12825 [Pseudoxanthomonas sp.]